MQGTAAIQSPSFSFVFSYAGHGSALDEIANPLLDELCIFQKFYLRYAMTVDDQTPTKKQRSRGVLLGLSVAALLVALPLAVWLDLTNLADLSLRRQANDLNSVITGVRGYYASNVVGRILAAHVGDRCERGPRAHRGNRRVAKRHSTPRT